MSDVEVERRHVEFLRGKVDQCLARGRRRLPDLHAAAGDPARACGRALVRCQRGVAGHEIDLREIDAKFFGRHLRDCRAQAGAEIDLAAIERYPGHRR